MESNGVLVDGFDRIRDVVHQVLDGLDPDELTFRPGPHANSIAWLIWHLARVQDDHIAGVAGTEQVWTTGGWMDRFGLPFDPAATGYGQSSSEVAQVRVSTPDELRGYFDAVHERTVAFVGSVTPVDLDRVVDRRWDPPVTLGVRLISVIADDLQHAGQAAYVRGLLESPTS
jgi:uncharacterized damage-inducible protein DinB